MSNGISSIPGRDMTQNLRPFPSDAAGKRTDGGTLPVPGSALPIEERPIAEVDVSHAVKNLHDYVQTMNRELHISVDEESGRTVIRVIDPDSKELIRQIPQEEILALARDRAEEKDRGHLLRVLA